MNIIKQELKEKIEDTRFLIRFLCNQGNNVSLHTTLKTSVMLMLYNIIESTVTVSLKRIHEELNLHPFNHLDDEIQKTYADIFFDSKKKKIEVIKDYYDGKLRFPVYEDYIKVNNIVSGNLDGRKINEILKNYGISVLVCPEKSKLLFIKNLRNKVAHGEITFKEASRGIVISEVEGYISATEVCLNELVNNINSYLLNEHYK